MRSRMDEPRLSAREFRVTMSVLFAALRESDEIVLGGQHQAHAEVKVDGSEVTSADRATERLLRACLRAAWPGDALYGEEYGGKLPARGRCWLVDPIDGTASYAIGMPMFGSLLSLIVDGVAVLGCIHLPALQETTYAAIGHGCWLQRGGGGSTRVHVAAPRPLSRAKVGMTLVKENPWYRKPGGEEVMRVARAAGRLRMVGDCVQYALLCRGVLDAAVDPFMKPWDVAALVPCVTEAGGVIGDLLGGGETGRLLECGSIVAASGARLRSEIVQAALGRGKVRAKR